MLALGCNRLRRRNGQQAGNASPADIVDPCEYHVVALDFDQYGCGQTFAVELAKRHGEISGMTIPANGELRAKRNLRRALRPAYRDFPFTRPRRRFMARGEFLAQAIGGLLQCKPPIIEHVSVVYLAHGARDIVEMGVLVRVEPD